MPQIPELANAVLFFAPGFLLVQTLYLGGIARRRSNFETVVWSVIVGVFIRWASAELVGRLSLGIEPGLDLEIALLGLTLAAGVIVRTFVSLFAFGREEEERV
jgi:hypothetical protein